MFGPSFSIFFFVVVPLLDASRECTCRCHHYEKQNASLLYNNIKEKTENEWEEEERDGRLEEKSFFFFSNKGRMRDGDGVP